MQSRIDVIRKREAEQQVKRDRVRLFQINRLDEERKSIEPALSAVYSKLMETEEKARMLHLDKSVQPKINNAAMQERLAEYRQNQSEMADTMYKTFNMDE